MGGLCGTLRLYETRLHGTWNCDYVRKETDLTEINWGYMG
jgi:hypothetical protein